MSSLRGTDITFAAGSSAIPDSQPDTPVYGATIDAAASNYGTAPVFPAPAPGGTYTMGLPGSSTNVNGAWQLFVIDTTDGNRGVIAGGWSLLYETEIAVTAAQANVRVPFAGGGPGVAATYPMTFDLTTAPANVRAFTVTLSMFVEHQFPDDLNVVLESPSGITVVLLADAGGNTPCPGALLRFSDAAPATIPNNGPMVAGHYRPSPYSTLEPVTKPVG